MIVTLHRHRFASSQGLGSPRALQVRRALAVAAYLVEALLNLSANHTVRHRPGSIQTDTSARPRNSNIRRMSLTVDREGESMMDTDSEDEFPQVLERRILDPVHDYG